MLSKSIALCALLFSTEAAAASDVCELKEGDAVPVRVQYIEDAPVVKDGRTVHLAKYSISNVSEKTFRLATYRGPAPQRAYPMDASLEYKNSAGSWAFDVIVLDHPQPPDSMLKVRPGETREFLASGNGGPNGTYRLKVREPKGCWIPSEPFKFVLKTIDS
ncbi:hypothetical protein [Lysobacter sp. Hz 25]|uniref:hypothetical protein n=1 Tax=Lysobacter sp. Hz 25 TaxID=3383698 RepID=UPI0038D4E614